MNKLVVYDSQFGNTEKVAQVIASVIKAKAMKAGEVTEAHLNGVSVLIVGSPTQGGRPTLPVQDFLTRIPAAGLKNIKVAAFDTRVNIKDLNIFLKLLVGIIGYAALKIEKILVAKGGSPIVPSAGFFVTEKEGPLVKGELERAEKWAKRIQN